MRTSQIVQVGSRNLVPVKDVLHLVSYSRDYVTRLAREGKIVAVQINRQWLVDEESLVNFFEHAKLEDQVRSVLLREERRAERDVREFLSEKGVFFDRGIAAARRRATVQSISIVVCSFACWVVMSQFLSVANVQKIAQVAFVSFPLSHVLEVQTRAGDALVDSVSAFENVMVTEETIPLDVRNGILILPDSTTTPELELAQVFSDPIEIVNGGIESGVLKMENGREVTVPFFTVPVEVHVRPDNAP